MKKRIVTVLLACSMMFSATPICSYASGTEASDQYTAETADVEDSTEGGENLELKEPEVDIDKYLTITDEKYKDIAVTVTPQVPVTDADVEDQILSDASYADLYKKKTEGEVEEGDTVNIDYVGKKDGEAFDGGTASGQDLTIGSGSFIPGFEDGLIGKKVGETVDLDLTFPSDYGVEDLAGQDVVFTVTINFIKEDPEITDDLVDQLSDGEYKKADDYRAYVRQELEAQNETYYKQELYYNILIELISLYPIEDYPQDFIDYYVEKNMAQVREEAEAESESVETVLQAYGTDEDQMKQYLAANAQQLLQQRIILGAIAKKENITLSDEDFRKILQEYADQYGASVEELLEVYSYQNISEADIRESELENKVMEYLSGIIHITEEEETEDEDIETLEIDTEAETDLTEASETETESET